VDPALASLLALLALILVSCISRFNVGVLGIALAWAVGAGLAGYGPDRVIAGFPTGLLVTLLGVTLLFGAAEANGTVERLAQRALRTAGQRRALLPAVLFAIAFFVSTAGPGAILSVAVTAPLAMSIGTRAGIPPFLVALVVANGANAGNLSPVSAVGVIANTRMAEAGLPGHEWRVWLAGFVSHAMVTIAALLAWRLLERRTRVAAVDAASGSGDPPDSAAGLHGGRLERRHWLTVAVILLWIVAVVGLGASIGLAAFAAVALLLVLRQADESRVFSRLPVGIIVMVTGMATLIGVVEATGGLSLFADGLARLATAGTVNGLMGFVTGVISTYSSTSAVVLPAFLPTAPDVAAQVGGDPVAVSLAITVGSALVDVSPLSTLGALCVAAVASPATARSLFRQLLIWGLSMTVVGAVLTQLGAGWMARW
jgi:di/tricarboxylate transporter